MPVKHATRRGFGRLRELPSGRYQAAYTGPDGALYKAPTTFPGKTYAEAWLGNVHMEITLGAWQPPQQRAETQRKAEAVRRAASVTVAEYADAWLADKTGRDPDDDDGLRPSTARDYRLLLDNHIIPGLGPVRLADLTPEAVVEWHQRMGAKKLPRARVKAYSLLKTIMNAAVADKNAPVTVNPCQIKGAGRSKRTGEVEPASLDELAVIAEHMPERLRLAVLLAAWCALRYGEVFELRRKDIVLTPKTGTPREGVVNVRRGVVWTKGEVFNDKPKTDAGVRKVTIPPHLLPQVTEHLRTHVAPGPDSLLFPSRSGGNLRPCSFEIPWHKARAAAGREDLTFHGLRHTGAVLAAWSGATIAELQARLGHATPAMAMHYQHSAQGRDKIIADRLSALARGEQ